MAKLPLCCAGNTDAIYYAIQELEYRGVPCYPQTGPDTRLLLLDIPSFSPGRMTYGQLSDYLAKLPSDAVIIGGGLSIPPLNGWHVFDLLKDEEYLAKNAMITADCAIKLCAPMLKTTFSDTTVLIIGSGRIGKCLAQLLRALGCKVCVTARSERERSILKALGFQSLDPDHTTNLSCFDIVFNTAPSPVAWCTQERCGPDCIRIDLASAKGLPGENVIHARGLPGSHAPKSSGKLICHTILNNIMEGKL